MPGRDIEFALTKPTTAVMKTRIVIDGKRYYQLLVITPGRTATDDAEKFFASLKL